MRMRTISVTFLLPLLTLLGYAQAQATRPEAKVAVATAAPKVDGVLDDAVWKDATELTDMKDPDSNAPKVKTTVRIARDDKNLYVAIECFDTPEKIKKLVANVAAHNGDEMWLDDSVELFIDPTNHRKAYYHLGINSKNVTMTAVHSGEDDAINEPDNTWNPKIESATKVGDQSWTVELTIPLDQFDRTKTSADKWGFNFLRTRIVDDDTRELTYWSPIPGRAHQPKLFGTLTSMPVWTDRAVSKKMDD